MKIGIVGANGQVGTELCFRLTASDVEVVPITRNELGAATFGYHGFEYRVGDLADQTDAKALLGDLDIVVIAAFAQYVSRGDLQSKEARQMNESLVKNAVRYASEDACVIYFSSIAAFGSDVRDTNWWWYTREKRHLESMFQKMSAEGTDRYVFRLGHVFGENQGVTEQLTTSLAEKNVTYVRADPARLSNIVHTTTIMDAILTAYRCRPDSDTYTVVNKPNWTWEEVIDFYAPEDASIQFHAPNNGSGPSLHQRIAGGIGGLIIGGIRSLPFEKSTLLSLSVYLPNHLNQWVWNTLHDRNIAADIDELRSAQCVQMGMFSYEPAPGPFLNELEETASRLDEQPSIEYLKID